jgi:hypothetical protein
MENRAQVVASASPLSTTLRVPPMPKVDVSAVPVRVGTGYPDPFNDACAGRTRRCLGA